MKPHVEVVEPRLFAGVVSDELVACINEAIADHGGCSIAVAGGRSPGVVYRALSKPGRVEEIDWSLVRIYLGDERWVPVTDNQSNFKMVSETLLNDIPEPKPRAFAVKTSLAHADAGAADYEAVIRREEKVAGTALPAFDIVLLGVGEDGHTASLFPHSPQLKKSGSVCVGVKSTDGGCDRVSLSADTIRAARRLIFIVRGEGKAEIVRRVIESQEPIDVLPARLWSECAGKVTFFVESPAAVHLNSVTR